MSCFKNSIYFSVKWCIDNSFFGMIAAPFPKISCENVGSLTSVNGITFPSTGLVMLISLSNNYALDSSTKSKSSSSSTISSKPIISVATNVTTTVTKIVSAANNNVCGFPFSTY